jgi:hypothetical protein
VCARAGERGKYECVCRCVCVRACVCTEERGVLNGGEENLLHLLGREKDYYVGTTNKQTGIHLLVGSDERHANARRVCCQKERGKEGAGEREEEGEACCTCTPRCREITAPPRCLRGFAAGAVDGEEAYC